MEVYINYPEPHITIHCDSACGLVKSHRKLIRREMSITTANMEDALGRLRQQDIPFGSNAANNDLWIHLELGTVAAEETVVEQIQDILGAQYPPLRQRNRAKHCPYCCR